MKAINKYLAAMIAAVAGLSACNDQLAVSDGTTGVSINTRFGDETVSRSSQSSLIWELQESFVLSISNSEGVVRRYEGYDNVPSTIPLLSDTYTAKAVAGDSAWASNDKRLFAGETPFVVSDGKLTHVDLLCKIRNAMVTIEYDDNVKELLTDRKLTIGNSRGRAEIDNEDTQKRQAYFLMPKGETTLSWTLTGTKVDGETLYSHSDVIENVQPAHHYNLIVKTAAASEQPDEAGGAFFDIVIEDTELMIDELITISLPPQIKGQGFDIDQPLSCPLGEVGTRAVTISASARLTSLTISCDQLQQAYGQSTVDLVELADYDGLRAAGLAADLEYDAEKDVTTAYVVFSTDFTDTYFASDGEFAIEISATDAEDRTTTKTLTISVSGVLLMDGVDKTDVHLSHSTALVKATLFNEDALGDDSEISMAYRAKGTDEWLTIAAEQDGTNAAGYKMYSAFITGLTPGTTYQVKAVAVNNTTGDVYESAVREFTTEGTPQLPNSGFEGWQTNSTPYLLYAKGDDMFWDSGNHGSATMSKNVTVPDGSTKHSGEYSVKMASQFVGIGSIGKFAAGNAFVGAYLKTDGTDGILGWGRKFTGRPTALKGWVKYSPVAISHTSSDAPEYKKGDPDKGIIYIALLTDDTTVQGDSNYPEYPVVIRTKAATRQLFDKDASNVIAYGELVFDATEGDGMVEFEIPLEYKITNVRPSYILCTMSASKGGDFFAGGSGSNMWVDDLELVYGDLTF